MKHLLLPVLAALSVMSAAMFAATLSGQSAVPVTADRLSNAQNEPQELADDERRLWVHAVFEADADQPRRTSRTCGWSGRWRSAACRTSGQNGPESEINPLVDNGFLYTSDGWGTIYKIDGRSPNKGEFVWVTDPGVKHEGNVPRTRGIALWEDLVIANLPDGRVIAVNRDNGEIVWDKMVAATNEFGSQGAILHRADHRRRQGDRRERRGRREDARLDRGARRAIRQRALALVRRAEARRSRQRNLEGYEQRLEDRRRRPLADRLLRSRDEAHHLGHRQSGADLRSAGASRRQPLHELRGRAERRHRQAGLVLPVHAERFLGLRRGRRAHAVRHDDRRPQPKGRRPFRAQRLLLFARSHQRRVPQGRAVRQRSELDQGAQSEDRQAARLRSEARRADLQSRGAGAARRPHQAHAARPGTAASRTSRRPTTP